MRGVVADTGPLHYLVLVGCIGVLPQLFTAVTVPEIVRAELLHPGAPQPVRDWAANPPAWLVVSATPGSDGGLSERLDAGERAAIALALSLRADLVLMDDRAGVVAAAANGLDVVGTIGILDLAARRTLIDLTEVVARLRATNFRYRLELLDALLDRHGVRTGRA